ncbi:MAG: MipA/OmpV family protein [Candidatus Competibacteraceae bacterium]
MMKTLIKRHTLLLLTAIISSMGIPAVGAEPYPLWELGIGIGGLTLPDYRGSDEQRYLVFPIPYLVYRGEVLKVDRERIRGLLFKTERLELNFSLNGSPPVKSKNNKAREGMPNLDPTLEFGPQLNVLLWEDRPDYKLTFQLPLRKVIATDLRSAHNAGLISNPILNLDIKNIGQPGWNLGLSGGPVFANRTYHQYSYGVPAAYETAERPAYNASGGYSGTQVTLALSKRFPDFWTGAFIRVYDLHGTAFDNSPLLERHRSFMAGIGVAWIFSRSDTKVMADE